MAYTKTYWVDDSEPAIEAENLNKIEQGIADAHEIVEWNQIKTSGTKIAEVTIDGNMTEVYAPTGGGGGSEIQTLDSIDEWNALTPEQKANGDYVVKGITPSGSSSADEIVYDNTESGLSASNVQSAIDEVNGKASTIPTASQIRYKETNVGSALNAVEVALPSKLDKVTQDQTSSSTILNYINNSGSAFGSMGFSGASDSPISGGGEITVLWFGSNKRITILCNGYPGTKIYIRHIWNGGYYDEWATLH